MDYDLQQAVGACSAVPVKEWEMEGLNQLCLRVALKIVIWIYDTLNNKLEIKSDFTKYKELLIMFGLLFLCQISISVDTLSSLCFGLKISPKLPGCFWPLRVLRVKHAGPGNASHKSYFNV